MNEVEGEGSKRNRGTVNSLKTKQISVRRAAHIKPKGVVRAKN